MNVIICDLCRAEIADGDPRTSVILLIQGPPQKEFAIRDVCTKCMDHITAFMDGLREGPPGASLMLPKADDQPIHTGPLGNGAGS